MPTIHEDNLIWIDLEMTGLDTDNDSILEIATAVTDKDLNLLAEGPAFAIRQLDLPGSSFHASADAAPRTVFPLPQP